MQQCLINANSVVSRDACRTGGFESALSASPTRYPARPDVPASGWLPAVNFRLEMVIQSEEA